MKRLLLLMLALGMLFAFNTVAYGQNIFAEGQIHVTANVIPTCKLRTGPINFGDYGGVPINGSGVLLGVSCITPIPYQVSLDGGSNQPTREGGRVMVGPEPGDTLNYQIYHPGGTMVWGGDEYTAGVSTRQQIGNGSWQEFDAVWKLGRAQFGKNEGEYNDTVGVTVWY